MLLLDGDERNLIMEGRQYAVPI